MRHKDSAYVSAAKSRNHEVWVQAFPSLEAVFVGRSVDKKFLTEFSLDAFRPVFGVHVQGKCQEFAVDDGKLADIVDSLSFPYFPHVDFTRLAGEIPGTGGNSRGNRGTRGIRDLFDHTDTQHTSVFAADDAIGTGDFRRE